MSGKSMKKIRVLFLCTQNAGRSQMAEGYLRTRYGDRYEAFSAGTNPTAVSRKAIAVMKEIGVDISGQRSKSIADLAGEHMDLAVALCSNASGLCPFYPFADTTIHRNFPDPGALSGSEEEIMEGIREIRDQIVSWIDTYFGDGRTD
jgi:arsenate reductase